TTREGLWREPRSRGATCSFFSWMGRQYGLRAMGQIVASGANDRWRPATGKTGAELVRNWQSALITHNVVRRHELTTQGPLRLTIQGGATAFVQLPASADGHRIAVRIQSQNESEWTGYIHRSRRMRSQPIMAASATASLRQ
ncbi:MAG TPA: hypothetical protein VFG20_05665, partial [Planctomycetaceae bacterium]|nr:hypothetical protein [Planctomycetaceae bacterium]